VGAISSVRFATGPVGALTGSIVTHQAAPTCSPCGTASVGTLTAGRNRPLIYTIGNTNFFVEESLLTANRVPEHPPPGDAPAMAVSQIQVPVIVELYDPLGSNRVKS
jgi:hypothetical protein